MADRKRAPLLSRFAVGYEQLCRVVLLAVTVNVAMLVHTLAGAVVVGFFPSLAAAYGTWRSWLLDDDRSWSVRHSWQVFHRLWRTDLAAANALGWPQAAIWAVLLYGHWLIAHNPALRMSRLGAACAGVSIVVIVLFGLFTLLSWAVFANFDESAGWTMRVTAQMVIARPLCSLALAALVVLVAGTWQTWPGILAAFGLSVPAGAAVGCVYALGRLPGMSRAERRTVPPESPVPSGAPASSTGR